MVERRHSWESPFHVGSNNIPLVGVVESLCRSIRDLECVGWIDLILVLLLDLVVLLVASNSLLLRRFLFKADGRFFLRGMMGENGILWLIWWWSLFIALWGIPSEALRMEWEQPI